MPIGQENTIFCCMHGKIRIVEKLLTLAACSAKAAGPKVVAAFQAAVRSSGSGIPSFKVKVDADTAATTISSLYGFHCDKVMDNIDNILPHFGESDFIREGDNEELHGPDTLDAKKGKHFTAYLKQAGHVLPRKNTVAELKLAYLEHTSGHVCGPHCAAALAGADGTDPHTVQCPITLHVHERNGSRLSRLQALWRHLLAVDSALRNPENATDRRAAC